MNIDDFLKFLVGGIGMGIGAIFAQKMVDSVEKESYSNGYEKAIEDMKTVQEAQQSME